MATRNSNQRKRTNGHLSEKTLIDDLPDTGSVFLFGKSRFDSEKFHIKGDKIVSISCGEEHTGIVTESGRVFMLGANNWGQLGLGHDNIVNKPFCVKDLKHEKVQMVACGRNHTIVATEKGNLYSWGCNSTYQLGIGGNASHSVNLPKKIVIESKKWKMLAAGGDQSFALAENGDLYAWGGNENGELGIEEEEEISEPKLLHLGFQVSFVACGYYHSAIVSMKGKLFTAGSNEYSQLGRTEDNRLFKEVPNVSEAVTCVSCGAGHTVFVTKSGKVFAIGDHTNGQLGLGNKSQADPVSVPKQIETFSKHFISQLSCGESHTTFLTDKGSLYICGDNHHDKLGLSESANQFKPVKVSKFNECLVEKAYCGGGHTAVLVLPKSNDKNGSESHSDEQENISLSRSQRPRKLVIFCLCKSKAYYFNCI